MRIVVIRLRQAIVLCLTVALLVGCLASIGLLMYGNSPNAIHALAGWMLGKRRLPIYSVQTEEKVVSLTFDATWGAERTPELLEILRENGVKSTFFLVTFWMEDYPDLARSIAREGHEIGLHSSTHPDMTGLNRTRMVDELTANIVKIRATTGQEPRLFRPPFGAYSDRLLEVAEDELQLITIQWSVDSLDWKNLTPDAIAARVTRLIHPGAIVLFHNNGEHTPQALRSILSFLNKEGYRAVPVSKLLHAPPYTIDHEGRQVPVGPRPEIPRSTR